MKKWTILLLSSILMIFSLAACGSSKSNAGTQASASKTKASASTNSSASSNASSSASQKQQQAMKQMQAEIKKGLVADGKTVAVVNGDKITGKAYNAAYQSIAPRLYMTAQGKGTSSQLANQVKQQTLNTLVGQTLILQDAKSKGYTASSSQIKSQYDKTVKKYGGKSKLQALLKKQDMTLNDLKTNISKSIVFQTYMSKQIGTPKVTDKEIQQFYDKYYKGQKNAPQLSKAKSQIQQQLVQQKQSQQVQSAIAQLKKKATVDIKI